jgi:hypothetical protein
MKRWIHSLFCLTTLGLSPASVAEDGGDFKPRIAPFLSANCTGCHDESERKGGLDLESLAWAPADAENLATWIKIHDKIESGEMPPKKKPRPASESLSIALAHLRTNLHGANRAHQLTAGRVTTRRLNRHEYVNTIHDLLGVNTPLLELLPTDASKGGFDTISEAHHLSEAHLERYLEAASLALDEATIKSPEPLTRKIRTDFNQTWHERYSGFANLNWTHSPEGILAVRFNGSDTPEGELASWSPPVPNARYKFRIRAKAMFDHDPAGEASKWTRRGPAIPDAYYTEGPQAADWHARRPIMLLAALADWPRTGVTSNNAYFEMSAAEFREFQYEARVPAGKTLLLGPFRAVPQTPDERAMLRGICAVVEWIDIEGPIADSWPPAGHRLLYGDLPLVPQKNPPPGASHKAQKSGEKISETFRVESPNPGADARRLIAGFLSNAFRRPSRADEIDDYVRFFAEHFESGAPFDEALRASYKRALCSPHFLFLQEERGKLDNHALACRVAYGLTSGPPDAALRFCAERGKLENPVELRMQVERLLDSPNAARFISNFLGNWLNLRDINFTQPDTKLYPEFEHFLQTSMLAESEAFFAELLKHDLSVTNIVHSDFAMLNERLAEHYGITGVRGNHIRKVRLPSDSHRGGLITQGAVLKVSANGTSTSPVVRGAYLLDRILGTPPDPPPANVPALEPDIRGAENIRDQLQKHRDQPACAACHARMDPLGFAMENFDVTGRWRTRYRAIPESAKEKIVKVPGVDIRFYVNGPDVKSADTFADGTPFENLEDFKSHLISSPEKLARCFLQKLVAQLTGAEVEFADREVIDSILREHAPGGYGVRSLLHAVIQSRLFTHK